MRNVGEATGRKKLQCGKEKVKPGRGCHSGLDQARLEAGVWVGEEGPWRK